MDIVFHVASRNKPAPANPTLTRVQKMPPEPMAIGIKTTTTLAKGLLLLLNAQRGGCLITVLLSGMHGPGALEEKTMRQMRQAS